MANYRRSSLRWRRSHCARRRAIWLKVLSMTDERLQDRIDARNLLRVNVDLDLDCVRDNLRLIADRGYARKQDLSAKLTTLLDTSH